MSSIKFGVDHATNSALLKHDINFIRKSALLADSLKYDSVIFMDHMNWTPVSSQIANNWLLLSSLINDIKNADLGIFVSDPHRYHPALLAQMHATLDNLTGGRFFLGVGAGEGANLDAYHIKWDRPFTRLKEAVEVMEKLWTAKPTRRANYSGNYFQLSDAFLQIKFLNSPRLYIAGNGPKTRNLTAKHASGWIPNSLPPKLYSKWAIEIDNAAIKYGRNKDDINHAMQLYVNLNDDEDGAFNVIKPIMSVFTMRKEIANEYNLKFPDGVNFHNIVTYNSIIDMKKKQRKVFELTQNVPISLIKDMCAFGPVDNVISKIETFISAGVEFFVLLFIGSNYLDQIKLFSEKILPYFRE
ncbi:MAG: LLM class flavin-dependent oxidoreductase [Candidatus Helarchaeota archaeon]